MISRLDGLVTLQKIVQRHSGSLSETSKAPNILAERILKAFWKAFVNCVFFISRELPDTSPEEGSGCLTFRTCNIASQPSSVNDHFWPGNQIPDLGALAAMRFVRRQLTNKTVLTNNTLITTTSSPGRKRVGSRKAFWKGI